MSSKVQCVRRLGMGGILAQPDGLLRAVGGLADRSMRSRLDSSNSISIPSTGSNCARCSALMIETRVA
jgi:hypothetical protein